MTVTGTPDLQFKDSKCLHIIKTSPACSCYSKHTKLVLMLYDAKGLPAMEIFMD